MRMISFLHCIVIKFWKLLESTFIIGTIIMKCVVIIRKRRHYLIVSTSSTYKFFLLLFLSQAHVYLSEKSWLTCELLTSLGIPSPFVIHSNLFQNLVLRNHWTNWKQSWTKSSLGCLPLKLYLKIMPIIQHGCCYCKYICRASKPSLCRNCNSEFLILYEMYDMSFAETYYVLVIFELKKCNLGWFWQKLIWKCSSLNQLTEFTAI